MKVVVKKPNQEMEIVDVEKADYDFLSETVGGYIEYMQSSELKGIEIVVNEEFLLIEGMKDNFFVPSYGITVKGNAVFVPSSSRRGLNDKEIETIKKFLEVKTDCSVKTAFVNAGIDPNQIMVKKVGGAICSFTLEEMFSFFENKLWEDNRKNIFALIKDGKVNEVLTLLIDVYVKALGGNE
jgi:hypothetical protein